MYMGLYPKKTAILICVLLFLTCFFSRANAAICVWDGSDNSNASDSANWTNCNNDTPGAGDDVLFNNNPSAYDCNWNITDRIVSFTIDGFAGTVTLNSNLNVDGDITITTGVFEANDWTIELEGNWLYFGGTDTALGDIADPIGTITVPSFDIADVNAIMDEAMGNIAYQCSDINSDGSVNILDVIKTLRMTADPPADIPRRCSGGMFRPGTSTVKLTGTNQYVEGDTLFYNLEKAATCTGNETLFFEADSLQTILGRLTLKGTSDCTLALTKQGTGDYWYLNPMGTRNLSFVTINYLVNRNSVNIVVTDSDSQTSGNNDGVDFGGSQCVCLDEKLILAQVSCEEGRAGC